MTKRIKEIIIILIGIGAVCGVMSFSASVELSIYFLLLIGGFSLAGWVSMKLLCKIRKKEIKHTYLIGVPVTSLFGMLAVAILIVSMKGEGEAAEGAFLFSPFIFFASIVAGAIVGRVCSRPITHNTNRPASLRSQVIR